MTKQPKGKNVAPAAVHSYLHLIRKNGLHPYIKWPRAAQTPSSWSVQALCAAYDWPKNAVGGGVIAIVELGGGWVQSDMQTSSAASVSRFRRSRTCPSTARKTNPIPIPMDLTAKWRSISRSRAPLTTPRRAKPRDHSDVLGAGHRAGRSEGRGGRLRRVHDLLGFRRGGVGCDGWRSDGADRDERDGRRHGRVRGVGRQ